MTVDAGRVVARLLLVAAMLGGMAASAQAQMAVPGGTGVTGMQSPAVFGGARRQQPGANTVSVSLSGYGGYDTNILVDNPGGGGPIGSSSATDSTFVGSSASLQWAQSRDRVTYFGGLSAGYRKFFDVDDFDFALGDASGGLSYAISPRQSFSLSGSVGVQPFYRFGVIGGDVPGFVGGAPNTGFTPDPLAAREQALRYAIGTGYQYQMSSRLSFVAQASRTGFEPFNEEADDAGLANLGGTSVGAGLTYSLTRKVGLRAGYSYTVFDGLSSQFDENGTSRRRKYETHNIDVGVNYSDSLTIASRTTFSFGTGTSIASNSGGVGSVNSGATFSVVGFASLQKEFLRTWATGITYNRSVAYIEVANSIGTFDSVTGSIGGLFTDRLDASAGVSYVRGAPFANGIAPLSNVTAGAQLRYGFSQNVAAYVAYTYGYFSQAGGVVTAPGTTLRFTPERQGVRFGVSVWTDLLR